MRHDGEFCTPDSVPTDHAASFRPANASRTSRHRSRSRIQRGIASRGCVHVSPAAPTTRTCSSQTFGALARCNHSSGAENERWQGPACQVSACQVPVDACHFVFGCCLTRSRAWTRGFGIGPVRTRWMLRTCSPSAQTWMRVSVTQQSTIVWACRRPMNAARDSIPITPVAATRRWIHWPSTTGTGGGCTASVIVATCGASWSRP